MLVLNLPFKALMFLTLMRPSLVLFLVLWLKLVKDFLKVRCRLAVLPFLISCLIWLDLVASLPLLKERILVIILLLHFLSLMLGSVLVLMLPLLVWLTPDLRIKKSLLKCNWTIERDCRDAKSDSKRDCWHSVGDFTPEYERPGICTKRDACLSTEGVYCSRCVYYGKHQSFQATAGFRDYAPNAYSSSNGWSVFYQ